uniref:Uncharacterized protein n=1 Tax=Nicotiana tabacum TaxID=4097 RepID=A0A1S4D031_TOBAC|nr:PREDICTED: uncharacterized protein LOC107824390 [Nicotiana tabacum]
MAAYSYALQVNKCSLQRPSLPHKIEHFSNPLSTSFKPLLRDLDQFPNISVDVTKAIKETSCKLLDAFVDFIFEFADQPLLPSQRNFAPVEEIGESTLSVTRVEGTIPDDFPEGYIYIFVRIDNMPFREKVIKKEKDEKRKFNPRLLL